MMEPRGPILKDQSEWSFPIKPTLGSMTIHKHVPEEKTIHICLNPKLIELLVKLS